LASDCENGRRAGCVVSHAITNGDRCSHCCKSAGRERGTGGVKFKPKFVTECSTGANLEYATGRDFKSCQCTNADCERFSANRLGCKDRRTCGAVEFAQQEEGARVGIFPYIDNQTGAQFPSFT